MPNSKFHCQIDLNNEKICQIRNDNFTAKHFQKRQNNAKLPKPNFYCQTPFKMPNSSYLTVKMPNGNPGKFVNVSINAFQWGGQIPQNAWFLGLTWVNPLTASRSVAPFLQVVMNRVYYYDETTIICVVSVTATLDNMAPLQADSTASSPQAQRPVTSSNPRSRSTLSVTWLPMTSTECVWVRQRAGNLRLPSYLLPLSGKVLKQRCSMWFTEYCLTVAMSLMEFRCSRWETGANEALLYTTEMRHERTFVRFSGLPRHRNHVTEWCTCTCEQGCVFIIFPFCFPFCLFSHFWACARLSWSSRQLLSAR